MVRDTKIRGFAVNALLMTVLAFGGLPARAEYSVTVDPQDNRGVWEGWGCSLSWWGNGIGGSAYENLYADLFFTQKTVPFMGKPLPGLGLNIVRYNIGGGGQNDSVAGMMEAVPDKLPWYKKVNGYWVNPANPDPASGGWDWTRDARQRAILQAAHARGVNIFEFFSVAPMWWMMDHQSSEGGALLAGRRRDFARYLASVVRHAQDDWGIPVADIEPFNEPSAWWWNYPGVQEGCKIPADQQAEVLGDLREELDRRGLRKVPIAASDENSIDRAKATYDGFQSRTVPVSGQPQTVAALVGKVNVHGYSGLAPWRDNGARQDLCRDAGAKRLWMSEYGDGEGGGMTLAQQITEDINFLRPTAWVYWQPVEPYSAWGFVNGRYADRPDSPDRGAPTWVYTKYYVMAQFSRFLRPGDRVIGSSDHNTIAAYDPRLRQLVLITVNYGAPQPIHYDLSNLSPSATVATVTETDTDGSKVYQTSRTQIGHGAFTLSADANSVYSIVISGVWLP